MQCPAIAYGESALLATCSQLLAWTVQCDKKEAYIGVILALDEGVQGTLMAVIEGVLSAAGEAGDVPEGGRCQSPPSPRASGIALFQSPASARLASRGAAANKRAHALLSPIAPSPSGCEASRRRLRRTSAEVAMAAPAAAIAVVPAAEPSRSSREVETELQALRQEAAELRKALASERASRLVMGATADAAADRMAAGRDSMAAGGSRNAARGTRGGGRTSLAGGAELLSLLSGRLGEDEDEDEGESGRYGAPIRSSSEEIAALKASLSEAAAAQGALTVRLSRAEDACKSLPALRDELDVLRPLAASKERAEAAVERLRIRLEEVPGLKETLRKSTEANSALNTRVLDLEREAARVAPLQAALEASKEQRAAGEVRASELEAALEEARASAGELREALAAATDGEVASAWTTTLAVQGFVGQEAVLEAERGAGDAEASISAGLASFRPEVEERIARLERENEMLRGSRDGASEGRLARLEGELDDARRIKSAFEGRMRQAQAHGAEADKDLAAARTRIRELEASVATLEAEAAGLRAVHAETHVALASSDAALAAMGMRGEAERVAAAAAAAEAASSASALAGALRSEREAGAAAVAELVAYRAAHGTSDAEAAAQYAALVARFDSAQQDVAGLHSRLGESEAALAAITSELGRECELSLVTQGELGVARATMAELEATMGVCAGQAAEGMASLQAALATERKRVVSLESLKGKGVVLMRTLREEKERLATALSRSESAVAILQGSLAEAQARAEAWETEAAATEAEVDARGAALETTSVQLSQAMAQQELESGRCRRLRQNLEVAEAALLKARRGGGEGGGAGGGDASGPPAAAARLLWLEGELKRISGVKDWYASRADVLARFALATMCQLTSGPILPPCLLMEARLPDGMQDRAPDLLLVGLGGSAEAPGDYGDAPVEGTGRTTRAKAKAGGARRVAIASAATAGVDAVGAWTPLVDPAVRAAEAALDTAVQEACAAVRATAEVEVERNSLHAALDAERAITVREGLRFARLTRELEVRGVRVVLKTGDAGEGAGQEWPGDGLASDADASFVLDFGELRAAPEESAADDSYFVDAASFFDEAPAPPALVTSHAQPAGAGFAQRASMFSKAAATVTLARTGRRGAGEGL
jgi:hypothetical protein